MHDLHAIDQLDPALGFDADGGDFGYEYRTLAGNKDIDRSPLLALAEWRRSGLRCALLTIVRIEGRSPRAVGAQMAVNVEGDIYGYLTGGCLEMELARMAIEVIESGTNRIERYGRGSRFIDMRLPCGAGIDVYFDQGIATEIVNTAIGHLKARRPFALVTDLRTGTTIVRPADPDRPFDPYCDQKTVSRTYLPAIRLRLYGAGFAMLQLAHMLRTVGIPAQVHSNDAPTLSAAAAMSIPVTHLAWETIRNEPPADRWTACVVMFHDHTEETEILTHLLRSQSFYVGAVGSRSVNNDRLEALRESGLGCHEIARLIAPAGAIPGARTATELACGIMADILGRARQCALVV